MLRELSSLLKAKPLPKDYYVAITGVTLNDESSQNKAYVKFDSQPWWNQASVKREGKFIIPDPLKSAIDSSFFHKRGIIGETFGFLQYDPLIEDFLVTYDIYCKVPLERPVEFYSKLQMNLFEEYPVLQPSSYLNSGGLMADESGSWNKFIFSDWQTFVSQSNFALCRAPLHIIKLIEKILPAHCNDFYLYPKPTDDEVFNTIEPLVIFYAGPFKFVCKKVYMFYPS